MAENNDNSRSLTTVAKPSRGEVLELGARDLERERESRTKIQRMAEVQQLPPPELEERKIIYPGMKNREALNVFRELRTRLYKQAGTEDNFVLMVCALTPEGGSSFVSMNLGAAIALDQSKTSVIVDCNLYAPRLHEALPVEADFGLADYLENVTLNVEDIIYSSGVRRMRVIPAGNKRQPGVEFFTSSRMRHFVQEVRSRYRDRYVILDAPPLSSFADARILSELCDLVLLVVPYAKTTENQVLAAIESIGEDKLAGVVFNS